MSHSIEVEMYYAQNALMKCYNCHLAMSGQIAGTVPIACGVGAATYTRTAQRKGTLPQYRHFATASWAKERQYTYVTTRAAGTRWKRCKKGVPENTQEYTWKGVLFKIYHSSSVL
jgi:hypothetical protein